MLKWISVPWNKLDVTKPLYAHWGFWIAILTPIVIGQLFAFPIYQSVCGQWDMSPAGYAYFLELFKFPLWLMTGSVVLGVTYGRFHFSLLKVESIRQTEVNNSFKNFYEHREVVVSWLDKHSFKASVEHPDESECQKISEVEFQVHASAFYDAFFSINSMKEFNPVVSPNEELVEFWNAIALNDYHRPSLNFMFNFNDAKDATDEERKDALILELNSALERLIGAPLGNIDGWETRTYIKLNLCFVVLDQVSHLIAESFKFSDYFETPTREVKEYKGLKHLKELVIRDGGLVQK